MNRKELALALALALALTCVSSTCVCLSSRCTVFDAPACCFLQARLAVPSLLFARQSRPNRSGTRPVQVARAHPRRVVRRGCRERQGRSRQEHNSKQRGRRSSRRGAACGSPGRGRVWPERAAAHGPATCAAKGGRAREDAATDSARRCVSEHGSSYEECVSRYAACVCTCAALAHASLAMHSSTAALPRHQRTQLPRGAARW